MFSYIDCKRKNNNDNNSELQNIFIVGDSTVEIAKLPANFIDLIITSPPYFRQRNYQHAKQIGQENNVNSYIQKLRDVFYQCKRILKNTGSIWVQITDTYDKNGSLFGVPEQFTLMMQHELGFTRRNTIIDHVKNPMPHPSQKRFHIDFSYFYWFVKSPKDYYFNQQYKPYADSSLKQLEREYLGHSKKNYKSQGVQDPSDTKRNIITSMKFGGNKYPGNIENKTYSGNGWQPNQKGAIMTTVWSRVSNKAYTNIDELPHYATFHDELLTIPIKSCSDVDFLVFDPFMGVGTTAVKAYQMNRNFLGVELNEEYAISAAKRIKSML